MKITLFVPKQIEGKSPYTPLVIPPVGATYVGTVLEKRGHDVEILDETILGQIDSRQIQADVLGISAMTANILRGYEVAREVRKNYGETIVLAGGPHVTFLPDEALRNGVDIVVRGEGERTVEEVVDVLEQTRMKGLEKVAGISFRNNNEIVHNIGREPIGDLDELPYPNYGLVKGLPEGRSLHLVNRLRGCPHPCTFCSARKMHGGKYRFRSSENVMGELETMKLHGRGLMFTDDNFFADIGEAKKTIRMMLEKGLIPEYWVAQMRVSVARDKEIMGLLQKTKFRHGYVGLESINPRTLKEYKKVQSVEDIKYFIRRIHDIRAKVFGMFVLGGDNDTLDTVKATADFFCEQGIERGQLTSLTPLPGSKLRAEWEKQKVRGRSRILTHDWSKYDLEHVVHVPMKMEPEDLQAELNKARRQISSPLRVAGHLARGDLREAITSLWLGYLLRARQRQQGFL